MRSRDISSATHRFQAVTITPTTAALGAWGFGSLTWNDGEHAVRSPLSARTGPPALTTPAEVTDVRASGAGSKVFSVLSTYTGPLRIVPVGLVPATRVADAVAQGDASRCYPLDVPAGAHVVRIALFDTDVATPGADLTLQLSNGATHSASTTAFGGGRHATIVAPPAGRFTACVVGRTFPSSAAVPFTLSAWLVGPATGAQSLRATGPASLTLGRQASVGLSWSVAAGRRYLGNVQFRDAGGAVVGSTIVSVND